MAKTERRAERKVEPKAEVVIQPSVLVAMRLRDVRTLVTSTAVTDTCARCGEKVSILPPGEQALKEMPHLEIVCQVCGMPELTSVKNKPVISAIGEIGQGHR